MTALQKAFPENATFRRDQDGELCIAHPGMTEWRSVADWVDEFTISGTTYDVIETVGGEVISVVLSLPGGGVSSGPVASRRFRLVRHEDVSGVSGTGVVAHGVQMPDGSIALRWCVPGMPTTWNLLEAIEHVELLNGHRGKTEVEWID